MSPDAVQVWLKKKLAMSAAGRWGGAVLALFAGVFVMFVTFWLAYAVLVAGEMAVSAVSDLIWSRKLHLAHAWRMVLCGLFLLALFVEWLRRSPWDLGDYSSVNAPAYSNALVFHGGMMSSFAMLLANPQASSTMLTELLYTGPRLVSGSWHLVRDARRLGALDATAAAWALAALANRDHAVTREEFVEAGPELDWQRLQADLAAVEGVVFLNKGLSLTPELRRELRNLNAS